jgi:multiple sugar transport system ATP-binding protein
MDEPLSNLDASLRVHTRTEIVDLHRRAGVTTLYVTHDQEEALCMADRIAVMIGGQLLQIATPEAIYRDPQHLDVATFIGSPRINLIPARLSTGGAAEWDGRPLLRGVQGSVGEQVRLGVRPEDLRLSPQQGAVSAPVTVARVEFLGAETLAHVTLSGLSETLVARLSADDAARIRAGDRLFMTADPSQILAFNAEGRRAAVVRADAPATVHG